MIWPKPFDDHIRLYMISIAYLPLFRQFGLVDRTHALPSFL